MEFWIILAFTIAVAAPRLSTASDVLSWRDPKDHVVLTVTANTTNTVYNVGDAVEYTCTATDLPFGTETLEFKQKAAFWEIRLVSGRNALTFTKVMTASDNNAEIFCGVGFSERDGEPETSYSYYAKSDIITLQVVGDGVPVGPTIPNYAIGQSVALLSLDWDTMVETGSTYKPHDMVFFTCRPSNFNGSPFIDFYQTKGKIELLRKQTFNMTAMDDGTSAYCKVWTVDDRFNSYIITSPTLTIDVTN